MCLYFCTFRKFDVGISGKIGFLFSILIIEDNNIRKLSKIVAEMRGNSAKRIKAEALKRKKAKRSKVSTTLGNFNSTEITVPLVRKKVLVQPAYTMRIYFANLKNFRSNHGETV